MNRNDFLVHTKVQALALSAPETAEVIRSVILFQNGAQTVARKMYKEKAMIEFLSRIAKDGVSNHRRSDIDLKFLLEKVHLSFRED